jgi:hypothetical protein
MSWSPEIASRARISMPRAILFQYAALEQQYSCGAGRRGASPIGDAWKAAIRLRCRAYDEAVRQTPEELSEHLAQQIGFLRRSAAAYDSGELEEAKRLATTVSTLVNTSRTATSLLTQMGVRDSMEFLSFAEPLQFRFPKLCLVLTRVSSDTGASFYPICNSPFAKYSPSQWVGFERWWAGEPIYEVHLGDGSAGTLNRLDLVRYLRCQDGGSHIDMDLSNEAYVRLSRIAETGLFAFSDGQAAGAFGTSFEGSQPILGGHLAAMRHVAWELEQSLIRAGLAEPHLPPGATA